MLGVKEPCFDNRAVGGRVGSVIQRGWRREENRKGSQEVVLKE